MGRNCGHPWSLVFALTMDSIWYARNKFIFENQAYSPYETFLRVQACIHECKEAFDLNIGESPTQHGISILKVRWNPPPEGWMKLNTDGSVREGGSRASCG